MYDWVRSPYSDSSVQHKNLTLREEEELCELQYDCALKMRFTDLSLDKFWISVKEECPAIQGKTINILLQILISYMCEQALFCLKSIKSKDINCLISVEDELCVCLSKVRPRIRCLCSKEQAQGSH
jgi:hypothetical protein